MTHEITLKEIYRKKQETGKAIEDLLKKFMGDTGLNVEDLKLSTSFSIKDDNVTLMNNLSVFLDVRL